MYAAAILVVLVIVIGGYVALVLSFAYIYNWTMYLINLINESKNTNEGERR